MQDQAQKGIESMMEQEYGTWNRLRDEGGGAATATAEIETRRTPRERTSPREEGHTRCEDRIENCEPAQEIVPPYAIVLAGDHGWGGDRLDEIGCRPLLELAGKPLIAHILDWLTEQGVLAAGICANSSTTAVRHCLREGREFGLALQYYSDVMPRGPAGCIRDAGIDSGAETFLVVSGMVLPQIGIADILRRHRQTKAWVTVVACPATDGSLEPSGLYLFSSEAVQRIAATGYQDIKETLLPQLRRAGGRIELCRIAESDVLRVTDLESYIRADRRMVEGPLERVCGPEYVRSGEAWIHRACEIHPSVRIVGPAVIGPGCSIEANVVVVGPTSIGMGCQVGRGAVISRSTIWPFCRVGHSAVIDNSLLARGSHIGAASRLSAAVWSNPTGWQAPRPVRMPAPARTMAESVSGAAANVA